MNITLPELSDRIEQAYALASPCVLCPRECNVNRIKGERGFCKADYKMKVRHIFPHFGEEPPISGTHGSGTIFFSNCNLHCAYCQNFPFSQNGEGYEISKDALAEKMLWLQDQRCHNINLVTPTHFLPFILESIYEAKQSGLSIPIVYNTSGYEKTEVLKLLNGIIDVYLPDMRYGDETSSQKYSNAKNYFRFCQEAVKEMVLQTGEIQTDGNNIIKKGVIIRHLILPNNLSASKNIFRFISKNFSGKILLSLMSQYFPYHRAHEFPELTRKITREEYEQTINIAEIYGLDDGWFQEFTEEEDKEYAGVYFDK